MYKYNMEQFSGWLLLEDEKLRTWSRCFAHLHAHLRQLQLFKDEIMYDRLKTVSLVNGEVATGLEIGSLISGGPETAADRKRYVFRVIDGSTRQTYFFSAEVSEGAKYSQRYLKKWITVLHQAISIASKDTKGYRAAGGIAVKALEAEPTTHRAFSASVQGYRISPGMKEAEYEVLCGLWLSHQLDPCPAGALPEEAISSPTLHKWIVHRTFEEFHRFDMELRYQFGSSMTGVPFPGSRRDKLQEALNSRSTKLLERRLDALRTYFAQILSIPAIAELANGSGSLALQTFLEFKSGALAFEQKLGVAQKQIEDAAEASLPREYITTVPINVVVDGETNGVSIETKTAFFAASADNAIVKYKPRKSSKAKQGASGSSPTASREKHRLKTKMV